jgi:hypothetical protein
MSWRSSEKNGLSLYYNFNLKLQTMVWYEIYAFSRLYLSQSIPSLINSDIFIIWHEVVNLPTNQLKSQIGKMAERKPCRQTLWRRKRKLEARIRSAVQGTVPSTISSSKSPTSIKLVSTTESPTTSTRCLETLLRGSTFQKVFATEIVLAVELWPCVPQYLEPVSDQRQKIKETILSSGKH